MELYRLTADPGPARHADPDTPGVVENVRVLEGGLRVGPSASPVERAVSGLTSFPGDALHVYETLEFGTRALLVMDYP